MLSRLGGRKCTLFLPVVPFHFCGLHEHDLTHLADVILLAQLGQLLGYGILLDTHLFTYAHGFGGGELLGEHLQKGQGTDVDALGLLALLTAQAVVYRGGLHHAIEDVREAPLQVGLRDGEALLGKHSFYSSQLLVAAIAKRVCSMR